eukprot:m.909707 g.909707  ORF g.909707 m.909707 type:complete len:257 (-) comp60108_c0_seq66:2291-3061(-)
MCIAALAGERSEAPLLELSSSMTSRGLKVSRMVMRGASSEAEYTREAGVDISENSSEAKSACGSGSGMCSSESHIGGSALLSRSSIRAGGASCAGGAASILGACRQPARGVCVAAASSGRSRGVSKEWRRLKSEKWVFPAPLLAASVRALVHSSLLLTPQVYSTHALQAAAPDCSHPLSCQPLVATMLHPAPSNTPGARGLLAARSAAFSVFAKHLALSSPFHLDAAMSSSPLNCRTHQPPSKPGRLTAGTATRKR